MTPYATQSFTREDLRLFKDIQAAVDALPDLDGTLDGEGNTIQISCHTLSRALAFCFATGYRDGYMTPGFKHSWLVTPSGAIIDPYPVLCVGGPLLIMREGLTPWRRIYEEAPLELSEEELSPQSVRAIAEAIQTRRKEDMRNGNRY